MIKNTLTLTSQSGIVHAEAVHVSATVKDLKGAISHEIDNVARFQPECRSRPPR